MKPDEKYMPSSYRKSDDDLNFIPFTQMCIRDRVDNDTVSINSHIIDLPDGKYDWTIDKTGTD